MNSIYFLGNMLNIVVVEESEFVIEKKKDQLKINKAFEKDIKTHLTKWLKREATQTLAGMLKDISDEYKLPYKKLVIKNTKSRWGSCTHDNTINLNWNLVCLPHEMIKYVVIHELVHTKVKNHSQEFWDEVGKREPSYRSLKRELKKWEQVTADSFRKLYN